MSIEQGTVNQRFEQLIRKFDDGNRSAFARRVDITPGTIADIVGGRFNKPRFEVLQKVFYALPNLNKDWLMFGDGPMTVDDKPVGPPWDSRKAPSTWLGVEDPAPEYYGYLGNFPILTTKDNTVVPIVEADKRWNYSKRDKQNPPSPEYVKYYEPYESLSLPVSLLPSGRHMVFTVTEYSMMPTLELEDYILCSYVERSDWKNISESTICTIISKTHNPIIARVSIGPEANTIRALFDNQSNQIRYSSVRFKMDDIEEIWSFTWRLTSSYDNVSEKSEYRSRIEELEKSMIQLNQRVKLANLNFESQLKEILEKDSLTPDFVDNGYKSFIKRPDVVALYKVYFGDDTDTESAGYQLMMQYLAIYLYYIIAKPFGIEGL